MNKVYATKIHVLGSQRTASFHIWSMQSRDFQPIEELLILQVPSGCMCKASSPVVPVPCHAYGFGLFSTGSGLGGGSLIHAQSAEYGQLFDRPFGLPYV